MLSNNTESFQSSCCSGSGWEVVRDCLCTHSSQSPFHFLNCLYLIPNLVPVYTLLTTSPVPLQDGDKWASGGCLFGQSSTILRSSIYILINNCFFFFSTVIQLKCAFHLEVSLFISVVEVLNTHKHNGGRYKHWKRLKMFPCKDYKQARKSPNKKTQYVHLAMPENYFLHCTILSL